MFKRSRIIKFVLVGVTALLLMGARPMYRGWPVGNVTAVDRGGTVTVDLGSEDLVMPGIAFSVINENARQVAVIRAGEVFPGRFVSEKLGPNDLAKVRPGHWVRWALTPETSALLSARALDTPEAYAAFISRYPASAFISALLVAMPKGMLKEMSPEYYDALGDKGRLKAFAAEHPGTGLAKAAEREIAIIGRDEAKREAADAERERRAQEDDAERKRREELDAKIAQARLRQQQKELLGKFINNSPRAVRFVFDASDVPETTVPAMGSVEARFYPGSYNYKVFEIDDGPEPQPAPAPAAAGGEEDPFAALGLGAGGAAEPDPFEAQPSEGFVGEPVPVKEGVADIAFDFWEVEYP